MLKRSAHTKWSVRAAVVEHRRQISDSDRRAEMHPQARVAVTDLLLRHLMAAAPNALEDALDGELDGDDHDMQRHEASGIHGV